MEDEIEDIALTGGSFSESPSGDLSVVRGVAETRQSVYRELPAVRGSVPRRPNWGGDLNGIIMQSRSRDNLDKAATRARACLTSNPRISKVHEVSIFVDDNDNTVVRVRADSKFGPVELQSTLKPAGIP